MGSDVLTHRRYSVHFNEHQQILSLAAALPKNLTQKKATVYSAVNIEQVSGLRMLASSFAQEG